MSFMMNKQEEYVYMLPDNIKSSLAWYTGGDYVEFNSALRSGNLPREDIHYKNITQAFLAVPPLDYALTVYKGIRSENIYETDKSFVSTSKHITGTGDFHGKSCCIMQITVSPGSKVLPLYVISEIKSEDEVLLDRNGMFSLTGKDIIFFRDDFKVEYDMKRLFCTYTPAKTVLIGQDIEKVNETKIRDVDTQLDLIVSFLVAAKEEDPDFFDLDVELGHIIKTRNLNLNQASISAIKMRVEMGL